MICFCSIGTISAPISTPRSPRATISRVGLGEDLVERVDRLGLLDLRDHARVRAALADDLLQLADVVGARGRTRARRSRRRGRARTRGRRGPSRSATGSGSRRRRQVDALVRLDLAADDDAAARAAAVDLLDARAGSGRRRSGRRARARAPRRSRPGATTRSPCLRPPARRRRTTVVAGRRACAARRGSPTRSFGPWRSAISASGRPSSACTSRVRARALGVLVVRAVREVEPDGVHPGLGERAQHLVRARARARSSRRSSSA